MNPPEFHPIHFIDETRADLLDELWKITLAVTWLTFFVMVSFSDNDVTLISTPLCINVFLAFQLNKLIKRKQLETATFLYLFVLPIEIAILMIPETRFHQSFMPFMGVLPILLGGMLLTFTSNIYNLLFCVGVMISIPSLAYGEIHLNDPLLFAIFNMFLATILMGRGSGKIYDIAAQAIAAYRKEHDIGMRLFKLRQEFEQGLQREKSLTMDLNRANDYLKEARAAAEVASVAKGAFLATMSHELRTPINAILGFAQLMQIDKTLSAEQHENIRIITSSTENLLNLINDVLEISKIEAGRVSLRHSAFDVHRLIQDIDELLSIRAKQKRLQLLLDYEDVPQFLYADSGKLRQVLINLLGNAIKFTEEGGVTLRLHYQAGDEEQEGRLFFEVEDTGMGIPAEEKEAIFEAFTQSKHSQQGTGLGLTISREYVALMGGELTVRSEHGLWSVFRFDIPVSLAAASEVQDKKYQQHVVAIAPGQPTYRILVVEDIPENRKLLTKLLQRIGFEVREANNGEEGLQQWELWQPHLIWMDMRMPIMDGYEATRRIKATEQGQATRVIALTASAFDYQREQVLAAGCDDFVTKPFREAYIFEKLHEHLGVEFIYEEEENLTDRPNESVAEMPSLTAADLNTLPSQWRQAFLAAANDLSVTRANHLIAEIRDQHPTIAAALTYLVSNYLFDNLLTILSKSEVAE